MFDYVRISCCVPETAVANTLKNTDAIIKQLRLAEKQHANFAVFPELAVTGYTCGDLFLQDTLITGAKQAVAKIAEATRNMELTVLVGAPLELLGQLYNCVVVIAKGVVWGVVPKTFLPNYGEFGEKRWFSSAEEFDEEGISAAETFGFAEDYVIPVGNRLVFQTENNVKFGAEICEDLWVPVPPSVGMVFSGAELIFNLSASNEEVGKREYRRHMVMQQSSKCYCGYVYVSSGTGESTSDMIFSGHSMIAENGKILAENENFLDSDYILTKDIDLGFLRADRKRIKSYKDAAGLYITEPRRIVPVSVRTESDGAHAKVKKMPFIPSEKSDMLTRCMEIFQMQVAALRRRLSVVGGKAVIGVSGGLDSTLALLVTAEAIKNMGLPATNICAVTMPCFGTTDRTFQNAVALMESLGVQAKNISIKEACELHFRDIGHDINVHNITYENVQARERTQVLMDLSNVFGGIVVGTGDLSELALGWCTYNGDQMSMYGVNAGIPKTMVQLVLQSIVEKNLFPDSTEILKDILDTPISPELLPPDDAGHIQQKTEDVVGPYVLHDFFLFYVLRFGFSPSKIYDMAKRAFAQEYEDGEILKWLKQFYKRFFSQQFKRSCMPEGVKVGSIGLSPRGGWQMPGDAESAVWLAEIDTLH